MIEGRAETPEQKREIVERILKAWLDHPEMRLAQLISNAALIADRKIFYVEDFQLANDLENCEQNLTKAIAVGRICR